VFVTREDDQQKTHVRFGDGQNGARLPAGTDNVVARYRVGSGAPVPPAGTLTSILRPIPGLRSIRNPVAVGGGANPDPPEQIRRYAPRSVLTFGRAISGDDYETVAAQTPGVRRARVYWSWDGPSQRTVVKVFVGDDAAAVAAATAALQAFADPNRPVLVALAAPIYPALSLTVEVDPAFEPQNVAAAVRAALLDPQRQPFGADVVQIGQTLYNSHVYDACLAVPGVTSVRALRFLLPVPFLGIYRLFREPFERHAPGEGGFYLLASERLHVTAEAARRGS
jgi:predicted phage baseplate assembly protein